MTYTIPWFFCLALAFFPCTVAHGQSASAAPTQAETMRVFGNGAWWVALSHDKKSDFVDGYVTAMSGVRRTLLGRYKSGASELAPGDPQFKARTDALIGLASLAERYDYDVDATKLLAGVDDFYKDSRDTRIGIEFALQYVRDTLNGKNAPRDLEKQLNEWRAIVNK